MKALISLACGIDNLTAWIGKIVSWLVLAAVLMTFTVVLLRYGFGFGRIWLQESYLWMHATVFMLGTAWTLQDEGHVRVDILYQKISDQGRCWVNLFGVLFLLIPTCGLILWISTPYVLNSWALLEGSRETGGIPAVYILKSLMPGMAILLLLQGAAIGIHNMARLKGFEAMPQTGAPPHE